MLVRLRCVFWLNLSLRVLPVQKYSECSEYAGIVWNDWFGATSS